MRMMGGGLGDARRDSATRSILRSSTERPSPTSFAIRRAFASTRRTCYPQGAVSLPPAGFVYLCSDLSRYGVADAVAASWRCRSSSRHRRRTYRECGPCLGRVTIHPGPRASRALNAIARRAGGPTAIPRARYIKLADGGLTDNYAVSTLALSRLIYGTPYAPMTERDAVKIGGSRDRGRCFPGPHGDWTLRERARGLDLALAATDAAVDATTQHVAVFSVA